VLADWHEESEFDRQFGLSSTAADLWAREAKPSAQTWVGRAVAEWVSENERRALNAELDVDVSAALPTYSLHGSGLCLDELGPGWENVTSDSFNYDSRVLEVLEAETQALRPHQHSRLTEVLEGWIQVSHDISIGPTLLQGPGREPVPLDLYLATAHHHPAVARESGGVRGWFRRWREAMFRALQAGADARDAVAKVSSTRPLASDRASRRDRRAATLRIAWVREHLDHIIQPGAPCVRPCTS